MLQEKGISILISVCIILLNHVIHEMAHVLMAGLWSVKVIRIQWFTYQGGTRVFFENEPDFQNDSDIPQKWAWIAGAGWLSTICLGYFFTFVFYQLRGSISPWAMVTLYLSAILFLFCDNVYFLVGSILNFGDIVGIRSILHISRPLSIVACSFVMGLNLWVWYVFLRV